MDLTTASLKEIVLQVKQRKISAKEIAEHFLSRAQNLDKELNSIITFNENILAEAEEIDQKISSGVEVGPLAGIPIGIKDMLCTKKMKTTAASKMLENFIPPYDSTVVKKIKSSGALILGKLNQDEFAMGSTSETSYFGAVKNPWNLKHVPGGSSGGSAAALAARLVMASIGTDTGGSIRQPASHCGVVGLKPTYGRVSRYGIIAYASSLDQAGPLTSSVSDAAYLLDVICGKDELDGTTADKEKTQFAKNLNSKVKGLRIGILEESFKNGLGKDVEKTVQNAISILISEGAEMVPLKFSLMDYYIPVYYMIASSEASSNLSRYDGVRFGFRANLEKSKQKLEDFYSATRSQGFGEEVKSRILLGTFCLSSGYYEDYFIKAGKVRRLIQEEYFQAFTKCDVILGPVSSGPAPILNQPHLDPVSKFLNDIFTTSVNLAGLPGLSVPFGITNNNLPIGIQLVANSFNEQILLNVASALESQSKVKGAKPHVI
jgi:aspartyl-tRNA(Asn)/glutamyl-tRNA(Gln) amidotransferase subunit A